MVSLSLKNLVEATSHPDFAQHGPDNVLYAMVDGGLPLTLSIVGSAEGYALRISSSLHGEGIQRPAPLELHDQIERACERLQQEQDQLAHQHVTAKDSTHAL